MSNMACKDCKYFFQHYSLDENQLFRVYCGHCTHNAVRQKRPDTKACTHFVAGPADTDAFATKTYLSKELLRYVLKLELLPQIKDLLSQQENL